MRGFEGLRHLGLKTNYGDVMIGKAKDHSNPGAFKFMIEIHQQSDVMAFFISHNHVSGVTFG